MNMGKKFVASYSGGKDSILAIYRTINQGLTPVQLIITYNTDKKRSWFHGIPKKVLESVADSINIPINLVITSGEEYAANFEKALVAAKELGADTCVFGDIDVKAHRVWCSERCEKAGLSPLFPLWEESRKELVYEFIDSGFTANFTVVDTKRLSDDFLGKELSCETAMAIAAQGADICGENGEYHTFVSAGPIFCKPVNFSFGEKIMENQYAVLTIMP